MKKLFSATAFIALLFSTSSLMAQEATDKSKRPSPPAMVRQTLSNSAKLVIDYSQPSLKGRTMGKDVEPMRDKLWRAGANEATTFEIDKPVTVEGKALAAGKYSVFMIDQGDTWTVILNKTWDMRGTSNYKQADDALRITVKPGKTAYNVERLTYTISKEGRVALMWGDTEVGFNVK